jgi:hypothetical protein
MNQLWFTLSVHRKAASWDFADTRPLIAKVLAVVSLGL